MSTLQQHVDAALYALDTVEVELVKLKDLPLVPPVDPVFIEKELPAIITMLKDLPPVILKDPLYEIEFELLLKFLNSLEE